MNSALIFPRKQNPYLSSIQSLQRVREISRGSFGEVHQYYNPQKNEFYAVKKMKFKDRNSLNHIRQIQRQIDLLYSLDSPYLIKLLDHFQEQSKEGASYVYLVMQFADGKNLCDAIFRPKIVLQFKTISQIISDICSGLQYLHSMNILHRDIKLQNVVLSSKGKIKIVDLGQSNFFGQNISRKTYRGTKSYFCPQIINHDEQNDKIDVWCTGVILYQLVCLDSPFRGGTEKQIMENIRRFKYQIPQKIKQQKELLDLFSRVFTWQSQRINAEQLKNHPWIKKNLFNMNTPKLENIMSEQQVLDYRTFLLQEIQKYKSKISKVKDDNKAIQKFILKFRQQNESYKPNQKN